MDDEDLTDFILYTVRQIDCMKHFFSIWSTRLGKNMKQAWGIGALDLNTWPVSGRFVNLLCSNCWRIRRRNRGHFNGVTYHGMIQYYLKFLGRKSNRENGRANQWTMKEHPASPMRWKKLELERWEKWVEKWWT